MKRVIATTVIAAAAGLIAAACSTTITPPATRSSSSNPAIAPLNASGPVPGFPDLRLTGAPVSITIPVGSCGTLPGMTDADQYVLMTMTVAGVTRGNVNLITGGDPNSYQLPLKQLVQDVSTPTPVCNTAGAGGTVTITEQTGAGNASVQGG